MKTGKTSLLGKLSGAFSIAMLALAFSIGSSNVVRAEEPENVVFGLPEKITILIGNRLGSSVGRAVD